MIDNKILEELTIYIANNYRERKVSVRRSKKVSINSVKDLCTPSSYSASIKADRFPFEIDESFSEMLLRKIDEKGIKDSECYNKISMDRRLFSKIRSDKDYSPSKRTAIGLGLALELPMNEFDELLKKAGFSLSDSNKRDVVVKYFVESGNYNIQAIDEYLLKFDLETIITY